MQSTPNKPEVFAGWQNLFPPINLNFTDLVSQVVKNAVNFKESIRTLCKKINSFLFLSLLNPFSFMAVVVCPKAYIHSSHRFRLLPAIPHPSNFDFN
jgi:hypothetical protein